MVITAWSEQYSRVRYCLDPGFDFHVGQSVIGFSYYKFLNNSLEAGFNLRPVYAHPFYMRLLKHNSHNVGGKT